MDNFQALLGHANGDITTHYSAAEIEELGLAVQRIVNPPLRAGPDVDDRAKDSNGCRQNSRDADRSPC
jgi:hypothetical protein